MALRITDVGKRFGPTVALDGATFAAEESVVDQYLAALRLGINKLAPSGGRPGNER